MANIFQYEWWYTKIGGRKWTYIIRDLWHKFEFFWVVSLVSLGIYLGHHYDWGDVLKGWLLFTAGYIFGHLFWGKEYIEGEDD